MPTATDLNRRPTLEDVTVPRDTVTPARAPGGLRWRRLKRRGRHYRYLLGRLAALPPARLVFLVRAQVMLAWAQLLVWTLPKGRLIGLRGGEGGEAVAEAGIARAREIGRVVVQVAAHGLFRPECLVRSVAIQRLLERERLCGGAVHVGVRMRGETFDAHAWVTFAGEIIGDREEHVSTFSELAVVDRVR